MTEDKNVTTNEERMEMRRESERKNDERRTRMKGEKGKKFKSNAVLSDGDGN